MRYWKPCDAVAPYVSGYHLYAVEAGRGPVEDVFFPSWAVLRIKLTPDAPWEVRPRDQDWQQVRPTALFGPTNSVLWSRSGSGVTVGAGLRPSGMHHLLADPAEDWANRIGDARLGLRLDVEGLVQALAGAEDDDEVPSIFDRYFSRALVPDPARDEAIGAIERALANEEVATVQEMAAVTAIPARTLQRMCSRAFGFSPRTLLRRFRFLRSLYAIGGMPRGERVLAIDDRYVDYSHFIKDSHYFLGMTPEEFLRLDTPLARQAMIMRQAVLGEPMQGLSVPRRTD